MKNSQEDMHMYGAPAMFITGLLHVKAKACYWFTRLLGSNKGCETPRFKPFTAFNSYTVGSCHLYLYWAVAVDRQLLHSVCWFPADIFSEQSMSTAVSCWEWIMGARQDFELLVNTLTGIYISLLITVDIAVTIIIIIIIVKLSLLLFIVTTPRVLYTFTTSYFHVGSLRLSVIPV